MSTPFAATRRTDWGKRGGSSSGFTLAAALLGFFMITLDAVIVNVARPPSGTALIAARFVQGAAAAVMMPSSMTLVGQAYPDPARRARAVAVWAMGGAIASSSGSLLGGLLSLAT